LETENLILRLPELADIPEILKYFSENEDHLSRECLAKDYLRINGVWRDHVLNSLTNEKWIEK